MPLKQSQQMGELSPKEVEIIKQPKENFKISMFNIKKRRPNRKIMELKGQHKSRTSGC